MKDHLKLIAYIAVPIVLFFIAMFVKNQFQKNRLLDIAKSYVKKEIQHRQSRIETLEKDSTSNHAKIDKIQKQINQKKKTLAEKLKIQGRTDEEILDLFEVE